MQMGVEYQIGVKDLCIDECDPKQTVYFFGCKDSVLQIKGNIIHLSFSIIISIG
ncbi:putative cyclase-associated protein CAP/septum formation inhibitor MinC [Helianthus debilis subsp. tardiflorus]